VKSLVLCLALLLAAPVADARPSRVPKRPLHALRVKSGDVVRYGASGLVGGIRLAARAGLQLGRVAGQVSGVTSLGLMVDGGIRLARARRVEERVEATRDLAGGASGLGRLGWLMSPVHVDVGLAGAGLQIGVGAYELARGLCRRDRPSVILGALDLGAGALFGASLLSCLTPVTAAGAIALTAARAAYANRELLRSAWQRLGDRLRERRERRHAQRRAALAR
jgi:hypothetical protein